MHHEVVIGAEQFFDALPRLVWHEDEPIAHPSSVPLYFVSRLAREHVKVVLTGEGSDELFAGYGRYPRALLNWRVGRAYAARGARRRSAQWVAARRRRPRCPAGAGRYARRSFLGVDAHARRHVLRQLRRHPPRGPAGAALAAAQAVRDAVTRAYGSSRGWLRPRRLGGTLLDRVLYADLKTYLVELLMKQDQMSMAASIESRVPFLDHRSSSSRPRLPASSEALGLDDQARAARGREGPAADIDPRARPKMGFPVPFAVWTRRRGTAIVRDVLLDRRARERGLLDTAAVTRVLDEHRSGRADHGSTLWSLLNLELWYRTWIDGEGIQHLGPAAAEPVGAGIESDAPLGLVPTA